MSMILKTSTKLSTGSVDLYNTASEVIRVIAMKYIAPLQTITLMSAMRFAGKPD